MDRIDLGRLALYLVTLGASLGCASRAEPEPGSEAPVESAATVAPNNIRAGEPKTPEFAMAALSAHGSECGFLPEEPGIAVCDRNKDGQVTLIMLWQDPRLFFISHILKADNVQCKDAAPKLNEINTAFDNLTVICADNISFRAVVTPGQAGLSDEEFFLFADEFRKEIQAILRAGGLKGIAKD